jgi:hypothetical protein
VAASHTRRSNANTATGVIAARIKPGEPPAARGVRALFGCRADALGDVTLRDPDMMAQLEGKIQEEQTSES